MKSFLVYCIVLLMCLCAEVFCTETCDKEGTQTTRNLYREESLPESEDLKAYNGRNLKATIAEANRKIIFNAVRTRGDMKAVTLITFDEDASFNIGGGMSPDTGHFKAPLSGIYTFSFSAMTVYEAQRTGIQVVKNSGWEFYLFENNETGYESHDLITSSWNMDLTQDDELFFVLSEGGLFVDTNHQVLFSGHLLMQRQ